MYCFALRLKSIPCLFRFPSLVLACLTVMLGDSRQITADEAPQPVLPGSERYQRGEKIYRDMCASCHGDQGQGVEKAYAEPLVGDDSIGDLAQVIHNTMPEGEPEKCVGEDAQAVAAYVHYAFYSEAAQIRNRPPRAVLAHLTADQLRQSISDLYAQFEGLPELRSERGVKAIYFDGDRFKNENKKIERVDPTLHFDFGHIGPGCGVSAESFYIYWEGSLRPDVSGRYEIIVRSTCSFVFELGKIGRGGRDFIDNHVQSGDKTEFRRSVWLTAGRAYPFKIDFIQRKRKTELPPARMSLAWVPPDGIEQIVPTGNLIPSAAPSAYALQTDLPPDDRSYGFERGLAVNRQWDESVTAAALEFAQVANDELWPSFRRSNRQEPDENRSVLRKFLTRLVEAAFRGPIDDELRKLYVDQQIDATQDDAEAIKRVTLVAIKSPRFLYPDANVPDSRSQATANRLALILFDSLPSDRRFHEAVRAGGLENEEQVRAFARASLNDYRARAKTRDFLYEWLNLGQPADITKNAEAFPGFDAALIADLRSSLDAFLDEVVWSERSDYREFFLADWAMSNLRLAEYYGPTWQPPTEPEPEQPPAPEPPEKVIRQAEKIAMRRTPGDPGNRYGLLTHPYLMSRLAYYDATSPIHRGIFLIRFLLGRTLRPPAESFSPLSPDLHPDLTTRERVHLQTSPESCQVCHAKINGLGFTLENFDAVGRYRSQEREKSIDATGMYSPRLGNLVKFSGPGELANYLAESDDAHRAFVNRAFQYFVKQPAAAFGADTIDRLVESFRASQFNVRELLVEIAAIGSRASH